MTPLAIEVLLHSYYSPEPHPRRDAPAVREIIDSFLMMDVIKPIPSWGEGAYTTTNKGRAWVQMICSTPLPVEAWIDPVTGEVVGHS